MMMTEETLAMLEQRAAVVRSPSVRLLCAEVRRLRAALEEVTQERDAIGSVFDAYTGDCDALRAERDALRAILAPLLDDPIVLAPVGMGEVECLCVLCRKMGDGGVQHAAGCSYLRADALLGRGAGQPGEEG